MDRHHVLWGRWFNTYGLHYFLWNLDFGLCHQIISYTYKVPYLYLYSRQELQIRLPNQISFKNRNPQVHNHQLHSWDIHDMKQNLCHTGKFLVQDYVPHYVLIVHHLFMTSYRRLLWSSNRYLYLSIEALWACETLLLLCCFQSLEPLDMKKV